jgi:hypothetical protein
MHPLECGFLRRKSRRDRRPGFPIEPAWRFYPKYLTETAVNQVRWIWLYLRLRRLYLRIKLQCVSPELAERPEGAHH